MNFFYDSAKKEVGFSIGDFPSAIQVSLQSCLDINGFLQNEKKFRQIVADNIHLLDKSNDPMLRSIIMGGQLLPVMRDGEKLHFGLNFNLNTYVFSGDIPGQLDNAAMLQERVCAWCQKVIEIASEDPDDVVTHSICSSCLKKYFPEYEDEVKKSAKMAPLKEIQRIVKDRTWQTLRGDLSWTKENISNSLTRLRRYLGTNPSYNKKVRVLNLLNGVARGGITNDKIKRMQSSLRKQLGVGISKTVSRINYPVDAEVSEDNLQAAINETLQKVAAKGEIISLSDAIAIGNEIIAAVKPALNKHEFVGAIRRKAPSAGDVDILAMGDPDKVVTLAAEKLGVSPTVEGSSIVRFIYKDVLVDFFFVQDLLDWEASLLYRTGPATSNIAMRAKAKNKGWKLNEHGLFNEMGKKIPTKNEKDIYDALEMDYLTPEERQERFALKKKAHCGPCTPLKMEAIRMLSDMHHDLDNFDKSYLGALGAQSEEHDNNRFIKTLNEVIGLIKPDEKTASKLRKLQQIATVLQDIQYRIDDGEFTADKPHTHDKPLNAVEKSADFNPSFALTQPAGPGGERNPMPVALNPREWWDAWNAYTQMHDKTSPGGMLNTILKKFFVTNPLSPAEAEKETEKEEAINKTANLLTDPDTVRRFTAAGLKRFEIEIKELVIKALRVSMPEAPKDAASHATKLFYGKDVPPAVAGEKFISVIMNRGGASTPASSSIVYRLYQDNVGEDPTDLGVINTDPFFNYVAHTVKKGDEALALKKWLTSKIAERYENIRITAKTPSPLWRDVNRDIVNGEYAKALGRLRISQEAAPHHFSSVIKRAFELYKADKAYDKIVLLRKLAESYGIKYPDIYDEDIDILAGTKLTKGIPKEYKEYAEQIHLILYGNAKYPGGGTIEAKRAVIRNMEPEELKTYVEKEKSGKNLLVQEPYGVQSTVVKTLMGAKKSEPEDFYKKLQVDPAARKAISGDTEKALISLWGNRELPSELRQQSLITLALSYGVGISGVGGGKDDLAPSRRLLLDKAAKEEDAELRSVAYALSIQPSIAYIPRTSGGKLIYLKEDIDEKYRDLQDSGAVTKGDRRGKPVVKLPSWLIPNASNEPESANREILFSVVKELPKDFITEVRAPVFTPGEGGEQLSKGEFKFKYSEEETIEGFRQLVLVALNDPSESVRATIRSHFNLPKEKVTATPTVMPEMSQPSANFYLQQAISSANLFKMEEAEKHLSSAEKAYDASKFKEEIDALKKKLTAEKELKEKEKEYTDKLAATYPKLVDASQLTSFMDWVAQSRSYETRSIPFSSLTTKQRVKLLGDAVVRPELFKKWDQRDIIEETPFIPEEEASEPEPDEPPELEKRGSPLSRMERFSRQPPTTWPLSNPNGHAQGFPLGPKDEGLLLKDVQQYSARPKGKWRTMLDQVYNIIFKDKNDIPVVNKDAIPDEKEVTKEAAAAPKSSEEAKKMLGKSEESTAQAIKYFAENSDEAGLISAVAASKGDAGLRDTLLGYSVSLNMPRVAEEVFATGKQDAQVGALKAFKELKHFPGFSKALDKVNDEPVRRKAVEYLADINFPLQELYKKVKKDELLQSAIAHELGSKGDIPFLKEALNNENELVRKQTINWLIHYAKDTDAFNALLKHQASETSPDIKDQLNVFFARNRDRIPSFYQEISEKDPTVPHRTNIKLKKFQPTADAFLKLNPSERAEYLGKLIRIVEDGSTVWQQYPKIREQVVSRFNISTDEEWRQVQPEVEREIRDALEKYPTNQQVHAALNELKAILPKYEVIPGEGGRTIEESNKWIESVEAKIKEKESTEAPLSEEERVKLADTIEKLRQDVEYAKEQMAAAKVPSKDLALKIEQLNLLVEEMDSRYRDAEEILKSPEFKKSVTTVENPSWKFYEAFLKTYEPNGSTSGNTLEDRREKITSDYVEPIRKKLEEEKVTLNKINEKLQNYYDILVSRGVITGFDLRNGMPMPREARELQKNLERYAHGAELFYKNIGALLPYAELPENELHDIEAGYYRKMEPVWRYDKASPLLQKGSVARLKARHWSDLIEQTEKQLDDMQKKFLEDLNGKLPLEARSLLKERVEHEKNRKRLVKGLVSFLRQPGLELEGNPFIYKKERERLAANKKKYDARRKDLLKALPELSKLDENDPKALEIKLKLKKFLDAYGMAPVKEGDNALLAARMKMDRAYNPNYPARIHPIKFNYAPGEEPKPYSLKKKVSPELAKEEEERIKKEIAEMKKQWPESTIYE